MKVTFQYNKLGNLSGYVETIWYGKSTGGFQDYTRHSYEYDSQGKTRLLRTYDKDKNNQEVPKWTMEYKHQSGKIVKTASAEDWAGQLQQYYRWTYRIDNERHTGHIMEVNQGGLWSTMESVQYKYDSAKQLIRRDRTRHKSTGNLRDRRDWTYYANGQPKSEKQTNVDNDPSLLEHHLVLEYSDKPWKIHSGYYRDLYPEFSMDEKAMLVKNTFRFFYVF